MIKAALDYKLNYFEIISLVFVLLYYGSVVVIGGGEINFFNKLIYPFYVLFLFIFLISKFYTREFISYEYKKIILFIWCITIYLNYSIIMNYADLNIAWLLGDFSVIICLLLSIFIGKKVDIFKNINNYFKYLVFLLFILMSLDFIVNYNPDEGQLRMYSRLMIVPAFFLYQTITKSSKIYFSLYLICLILSIFTNMRYAFIMTVFLMFIFFVLFVRKYLSNIFKVKNILFFISLAILFFLTLLSDDAFLERWRFFKLFSSDINTNQIGLISTFAVRYFEVVDTISHIKNTFNPLTVFFGNGAGAAFKADLFWTWANNEWYNIDSFSSQSHKHILHFGPMRVFFRYGVLGLIIVGIFFTDLVRHMKISYHKLNINFVILISLISLSLRFVIQPIFNDLLMSILIIAFYNLRDRKKLT